ncbi:MAG TPA: calcium-binding protein, partial [Phenylobacterium sp.]|uniref:calcium-binding protein n=1 Tax=Phenylobacterium sp. TaxID=1871053 RepID=UPI002C6610BB
MATFVFETMTAAQATSFNGATDTIVFQNTASSGAKMSVAYEFTTTAPSATSNGGVTVKDVVITDLSDGISHTFGTGALGTNSFLFPDASTLFVGGTIDDVSSGDAKASSTNDGLFGGLGDDSLFGGGGNDVLQGNQGFDTLDGGTGNDTIFGGQDDDLINGSSGHDFVNGNKGADTLDYSNDTTGSTLLGGQGDDLIFGGTGNDFINGNLGNDDIEVSGGG